MPPTVFFLFRIDLAMKALFWFHTKLKVVFSSSVKKVLDGDSIESVNYFRQYGHFHALIIPNHEHGMFLHLCVSSLISLSSDL